MGFLMADGLILGFSANLMRLSESLHFKTLAGVWPLTPDESGTPTFSSDWKSNEWVSHRWVRTTDVGREVFFFSLVGFFEYTQFILRVWAWA